MRFLAVLATLGALTACQMQQSPEQMGESSQQALKKVWHLTAIKGMNVPENAVMDWRNLPRASAKMGCNQLGFQVNVQSDKDLSINGVFATRMACPDMRLEQAFGQQIVQMKHYQVKGKQLVLSAPNGEQLRFEAR